MRASTMHYICLIFVWILATTTASSVSVSSNLPSHVSSKSTNNNRKDIKKLSRSSKNVLNIRGGGGHEEISSLDWRYFLAGGICAATSHGITTPIDVVKTKIQTNPEKYKDGLLSAAKKIVQEEGAGILLAGLGPTVVGYGIEGALKFGAYESFKKVFANATPSKVVNFLLASVVAGAVASVVLCPMEETRIKMVGEPSWANENLLSGLLRLVKETGIFATFGGLPAMLSKQVPYTMGKQVSFDLFAGLFYFLAKSQLKDPAMEKQTKLLISFASSVCASILACISSQPGDMILTATYKGGHGHGHGSAVSVSENDSTNFFDIIAKIYKERGLGGFYVGIQARLAHVVSIITSQLMLYDVVKVALGLPVTGSH